MHKSAKFSGFDAKKKKRIRAILRAYFFKAISYIGKFTFEVFKQGYAIFKWGYGNKPGRDL